MRRLIILLSVCLGLSMPASAQSIKADLGFINYLIGNDMSADALAYLEGRPYTPSDTLSFLKGLAAYNSGLQNKAASCFACVSEASSYREQSIFTGVVSFASISDYASAAALVNGYRGPRSELKQFDLAALALLQNDKPSFDSAASHFTYSDYSLVEGERILSQMAQTRFGHQKSPALAAFASAVIPGAGKIYAGRLDEGIASFLCVGTLAAITAENWVKCGPDNWKTILFGSLGAIFYIGNIYGSYVSVGIQQDQTRNAQNAVIVYHLNIPVRSIFR